MGQVTKNFAERIIANSKAGNHSPLTVWEEQQLAHAWLLLNEVRGRAVAQYDGVDMSRYTIRWIDTPKDTEVGDIFYTFPKLSHTTQEK